MIIKIVCMLITNHRIMKSHKFISEYWRIYFGFSMSLKRDFTTGSTSFELPGLGSESFERSGYQYLSHYH